MKTAWATVVLCAAYVWSAATQPARPPIDIEADAKAELLALHHDARRAHFARDVDALLATLPDAFTYVRDGKVEIRSKDSMRQRFTEYFRGAEFTAWDDLEPPIIHVSRDGQMGWMIVRVKIAYTKTDAEGKKQPEQTVMAWMSAYEKHNGKWLHVANTTTVEPY
jgi:hypothetical protein